MSNRLGKYYKILDKDFGRCIIQVIRYEKVKYADNKIEDVWYWREYPNETKGQNWFEKSFKKYKAIEISEEELMVEML